VAPQPVSFSYDGNSATATQMTFSAATEDLTLADDIQFTMKDGTRATIKGELFYNLKTKVFQVRGDQQFEFGM
jgi:hypothetical protein